MLIPKDQMQWLLSSYPTEEVFNFVLKPEFINSFAKILLVYVTFSQGNDGVQGLQTAGTPAISSGAMAIGSVDNTQTAQFYLTTPAGSKIVYSAGNRFGGWHSIVNSTIVVNGMS